MVFGISGVTRIEGITVVTHKIVVTSLLAAGAAALLSLMHEISPGGNIRSRIAIFAEASGGGVSGGTGVSSSNVGIAIAVTAMAGLAIAATLAYSRR